MKKIFKIARLELSIMFYSPIAWLVLIIFIVQTGLTFTDLLYSQETNQQLGRPLNVLSKVLFAGEDGILATVQKNLYLYIPLLTMGLFSRETSSGSIKLLLSSPVTVPQIVFGKFLSMMIYTLLLAMILASFIISGIVSIEALDIKFVLGGILGIYLLMCAYSAIGLFMSSLTTYQVVAAISTLAILAALNFIGEIGQAYDLVRDITYWFSISGRADQMINGLISTKDLIYFFLVISLFLVLTIIKLDNERKTKSNTRKILEYSGAIITVAVIGYITSLPSLNYYYDTTRFKDRTLTKTSQEIIKNIKQPVEITTYVNAIHYSASYGAPENRIKDLNRFESYRRFLPDMKMNYVTYYDTLVQFNDTTKTLLEKAKKAASAHKFDFDELLPPEEIKKEINLIPENNRLVRMVNIGDKQTPLRMFDDIYVYPNESEISAALKRLVFKPSKVGILTGQKERSIESISDNGYKIITNGVNVRGSLINQGFEVMDVPASASDFPEDLDVLVIADPKTEFSPDLLEKLESYISNGGNLVISGEPGRQDLLNPLLEKIGVAFAQGTLLQETENYELDLIQAKFTDQAASYGFGFYEKAIVTLPGAMAVTYADTAGFKVEPILYTNPEETWNKLGEFDLNTQKIEFDSITDQKLATPVALALTREAANGTQKIMVLGDSDYLSNSEMNRNNLNTVNSSFAVRMFRWFSNGEYPVNTGRTKAIDTVIKLDRSEIQWLKGVYAGIIPLALGGLGMIVLIRRKRN
ncbi:Gldg family protein [uncultured Salegentibacter sp.]|uniref:Gldg family protein n=1 Tax=uncultured Salegentibacter sp. TaxID=259320 RepID=UPI0025933453|nr:Gldg family protein [uncultured Salegentibacter sp.]